MEQDPLVEFAEEVECRGSLSPVSEEAVCAGRLLQVPVASVCARRADIQSRICVGFRAILRSASSATRA
jgi:hypothetical protein